MAIGKERFPRNQDEMWTLAQDFRERGFGTSFVYNFGYKTTGRKQSQAVVH